jgi:penicillin-binding protein 2
MAIKISRVSSGDFGSVLRANVLKILILIVALIYTGRLGYLQILKGTIYKKETDAQAFKIEHVEPFRGNIFGRDGEILVDNNPSFTIRITPNDFRDECIPLLAHILEIDSIDLRTKIKQYSSALKFYPIKVFRDVEYRKIALIEEYNELLPGVDVTIESKRKYYFSPRMSHLVGYVNEVSRKTLDEMPYYKPGDSRGQTGVELTYEDELRGEKGANYIAVNSFGKKVTSFNDGKTDMPALNGNDLYITIDTKLQKRAEDILRNRRGAIVALDPNNGEILAIVSKPDYNIRTFREDFHSLINNRYKPLINRSVNTPYPPGSTWKMLVSIAAMQEGIINENTKITCNGIFQYGGKGKPFGCHGTHGSISVRRAIQVSCNVFFYKIGPELGLEKMFKYGTMFGFGQKTGVDIPNEIDGLLPSVEYVKKRFGAGVSTKGRMVIYAIGQGEILVTPIQMASYVATIANRGTLYQPHLGKAVYNRKLDRLIPIAYKKTKLPIDPHIFDVIHDAMYDAVNRGGGTGDNAIIPGIAVCGKTGTAQNTRRKDHSWFVCFAPKDNPQIAIAVLVENAGFGGDVAAPIARQIMEYFFFGDKAPIEKKVQSVKNTDIPEQTSPANQLNTHPD